MLRSRKNSVTTSDQKVETIKYVLSKSLKLCLHWFLCCQPLEQCLRLLSRATGFQGLSLLVIHRERLAWKGSTEENCPTLLNPGCPLLGV